MHLLADVLLIPLSLSVLSIGVLAAATSPWGLLRYRWVLIKLIATCAVVLLSLLALPAMTRIAYQDATQHARAAVGRRHPAHRRQLGVGRALPVPDRHLHPQAVGPHRPWPHRSHPCSAWRLGSTGYAPAAIFKLYGFYNRNWASSVSGQSFHPVVPLMRGWGALAWSRWVPCWPSAEEAGRCAGVA